MADIDWLLEIIADRCDADEIIDLCGVGSGEAVELLRSHIIEHQHRFIDYLGIYEEDDDECLDCLS